MGTYNAVCIEEEIFALEGVRVVLITGARYRKLANRFYVEDNPRKLIGTSSVLDLKNRVRDYASRGIIVIKGDGTIAKDTDRMMDVRNSYVR